MELFLIRHGQSLNNARPQHHRVEDPPLTEIGHQQCDHLGRWIATLNMTHIFTSPFLRALETADYVAQWTRLKPEVRVELHEQGGCVSGASLDSFVGRPGMTRSQIHAQFPEFEIAKEIGDEGWWESQPFETEVAARRRAKRLVAKTADEFAGVSGRIALIMHGDFKRLVLEELQARPLETPFNTSVTKILVTPAGCRFKEFNRVDHLPSGLLTK